MKRNFDLIRELLKLSEDCTGHFIDAYTLSPRYSKEEIAFNVKIMEEAGLIKAYIQKPNDLVPYACMINRMTWKGCEFLDSIRDDAIWSEIKKLVSTTLGTASIEVILALAKQTALNFLNL